MRFEKWHALGNDYVIVTEPVEPAARAARSATATRASAPTACCCCCRPTRPGFVARLRIFNPDGSEAELSGNGAREAVLYLHRRGWTDARQFSIQTIAGEIRPTILDERTCRVDMGRARVGEEAEVAGRRGQEVVTGNPQFAIRVGSLAELEAVDLRAEGPAIEHDAAVPRTAPTCRSGPRPAPARSARGSSSAGWGRRGRSGTGAIGAAVAHVLRGGDSPVTVVLDGGELTVDVGEDLHVDLTGWAEPVFAGEWPIA